MLKMNEDLEGALQTYVALLDKEAYFEAHEVLEEAWHPLRLRKDPLANLVKGLINGAVSFEHIKRHKKGYVTRAQKVMAAFERHKALCQKGIRHEIHFDMACQRIEALKKKHRDIFKHNP